MSGIPCVRWWCLVHLSFCVAGLVSISMAADIAQDDYGAPAVQVRQEDGKWIISGPTNRVELRPSDLQMTLHAGDDKWSAVTSSTGDLVVETSRQTYTLRLADAVERAISVYQTGFKTGLKIALTDFLHEGTKIDLHIDLFACLEGRREELVCEVVADEDTTRVLECLWPPGLAEVE